MVQKDVSPDMLLFTTLQAHCLACADSCGRNLLTEGLPAQAPCLLHLGISFCRSPYFPFPSKIHGFPLLRDPPVMVLCDALASVATTGS